MVAEIKSLKLTERAKVGPAFVQGYVWQGLHKVSWYVIGSLVYFMEGSMT